MKFNLVLDMYNFLYSYLSEGIIYKDELEARVMLKSNWKNLMIYADVK